MRLKKIKNAYELISSSNYFIKNPEEHKNKWNKVFGNDNKIELEIGMGKGDFLISRALNNPVINYIGIEKYDSVLVSAIKKLDEKELSNIRIINMDAMDITNVFGREISKIYLNFSDPWPKKRHAKRRLTHEKFLKIYDEIFKNNVNIEMKTDNDDLFIWSIQEFENHGYKIKEIDRDRKDIYKTEYEQKFISKGKNINYVNIYSKEIDKGN